jgi:hypothetical protein
MEFADLDQLLHHFNGGWWQQAKGEELPVLRPLE